MLRSLFGRPHLSALVILIWMSVTGLLSDCQTLYERDDDGGETDTGVRYESLGEASLFDDDADSILLNTDGEVIGEQLLTDEPEAETGPERRSGAVFPGGRISPEETRHLSERLKGLYRELKNDAALNQRRIVAGSIPPVVPPRSRFDKRDFLRITSSPVCPAHSEWLTLTTALDVDGYTVEVFQPSANSGSGHHQWFYTTNCDYDFSLNFTGGLSTTCPRCCRGIERWRYHSRCLTLTTFAMALVRRPRQTAFDWNWIHVNTSCSCYISPA